MIRNRGQRISVRGTPALEVSERTSPVVEEVVAQEHSESSEDIDPVESVGDAITAVNEETEMAKEAEDGLLTILSTVKEALAAIEEIRAILKAERKELEQKASGPKPDNPGHNPDTGHVISADETALDHDILVMKEKGQTVEEAIQEEREKWVK